MKEKEEYQSPWIVHESTGPVAGSVSQNWVWRRTPPGALKQQESLTAVELWQLRGTLEGQLWMAARAVPAMVVRLRRCCMLS